MIKAEIYTELGLCNDDYGNDVSFTQYWVVIQFGGITIVDEYFYAEHKAREFATEWESIPLLTKVI